MAWDLSMTVYRKRGFCFMDSGGWCSRNPARLSERLLRLNQNPDVLEDISLDRPSIVLAFLEFKETACVTSCWINRIAKRVCVVA